MFRFNKNSRGFTVIEGLLIVLTLAVIGTAGYFVAKHVDNKNKVTISSTKTTGTATKPTPSTSPSKTTTPTTTTPVACSSADVTGSISFLDGAAGSDASALVVTNKSSHSCILDGYPLIKMEDSSHNFMALSSGEGSGMLYTDPGASQIILLPQDSAVSVISYNEGGDTVNSPAFAQIKLPDDSTSFVLPTPSGMDISTQQGSSNPAFTISAFRAGKTPPQPN